MYDARMIKVPSTKETLEKCIEHITTTDRELIDRYVEHKEPIKDVVLYDVTINFNEKTFVLPANADTYDCLERFITELLAQEN